MERLERHERLLVNHLNTVAVQEQRAADGQIDHPAANQAPPTRWGPYIGPPPNTPPNPPDFEHWYSTQLTVQPDYKREDAYGHFYNLAGHVGDETGYVATNPEAECAAEDERERAFRAERERDGTILGYGFRSIHTYVNSVQPDYTNWNPAKMNDPYGIRDGEQLPGAKDHRIRGQREA